MVFIVLIASLIFLFGLEFGIRATCQTETFSTSQVASSSNFITVNGKVVDFTKFTDNDKITTTKPFAGKDLSNSFPEFTLLGRLPGATGYTDPDIQKCIGARINNADKWLATRLKDPGFKQDNGRLVNCPEPNGSSGLCFFSKQDRDELASATVGDLVLSKSEVAAKNDLKSSNAFVIIQGKVYDLGRYLSISTDGTNVKPDVAFLPDPVTQILLKNIGGDATASFLAVPSASDTLKCMDKLFYAGLSLETASTQSCTVLNPLLFAIYGLILLGLIPKVFLSFMPAFSSKETSDAHLMVLVPCYAESEDQLKETIESIAMSDYRASQMTMILVCDGNVVLPDSNIETYQAVLDILNHRSHDSKTRPYNSLGQNEKSLNTARVYSGLYSPNGNKKIPYLVISKNGTRNEAKRAGNRGKKDSLLILFQFLSKLSKRDRPLSPLEYEIYQHMLQLEVEPRRIEFCVVLDADSKMEMNAIPRMITVMDNDPKVSLVVGQTRVQNAYAGPFAMLQAFPMLITHHLNLLVKSTFRSLISPTGCLNAYRLRYTDGTPCVLNPEIINQMAFDYQSPKTMHERNLFVLGEDASFGLIIKKVFPGMKFKYEPSAVAYTKVPTGPLMMISFWRKWFNVQFHLNWEYLFLEDQNGCFPFSPKAFSLVDCLSAIFLPAVSLYMYWVVARFVQNPFSYSDGFVIASFFIVFLLWTFSALIRLRFGFLIFFILHLTFGIPLFQIIIPLISFFNSNNFKIRSQYKAVLDGNGTRLHPFFSDEVDDDDSKTGQQRVSEYSLNEWQNGNPEQMAASHYGSVDYQPMEVVEEPALPPPIPTLKTGPNEFKYPETEKNERQSELAVEPLERKSLYSSMYSTPSPLSIIEKQSILDQTPRQSEYYGTVISNNLNDQINKPPPSIYNTMKSQNLVPISPISTGKNTPVRGSIYSHFSPVEPPQKTAQAPPPRQTYYKPTNFNEDRIKIQPKGTLKASSAQNGKRATQNSTTTVSPMRAVSIAPSDYMSDYAASSIGDRTSKRSFGSRPTTSMYQDAPMDDQTLYELSGISKEEIREEIRFVLQDADLNSITRREVKEHLYVHFGESIEYYNDFINICIEEFTLEKLALL